MYYRLLNFPEALLAVIPLYVASPIHNNKRLHILHLLNFDGSLDGIIGFDAETKGNFAPAAPRLTAGAGIDAHAQLVAVVNIIVLFAANLERAANLEQLAFHSAVSS
jgi:hypothetical protein